jgi:ATP-dependent exoDNAse (exonuclease V) beta subunit
MSAEARAAAAAARQRAHDRMRATPWSVTAVTAEARHLARMVRAAEPAADDDPTVVVNRTTPSHRADAGIAWGTLIHGLLEHAMRHPGATREDLCRLARWLSVEEPQLRPVIDDAIDTVQAVAAAGFWQEAAEGERSVETPFAFASEPGVGLMGVIDLTYRTADGWRVIDYKTDVTVDAATAEKYHTQLEAYRHALEACGLRAASATVIPVRLPPTAREPGSGDPPR